MNNFLTCSYLSTLFLVLLTNSSFVMSSKVFSHLQVAKSGYCYSMFNKKFLLDNVLQKRAFAFALPKSRSKLSKELRKAYRLFELKPTVYPVKKLTNTYYALLHVNPISWPWEGPFYDDSVRKRNKITDAFIEILKHQQKVAKEIALVEYKALLKSTESKYSIKNLDRLLEKVDEIKAYWINHED